MDKILHDLKDSKLWEIWYIPYNGCCRILSINSTIYGASRLGFHHVGLRTALGFYSRYYKGLGFTLRLLRGSWALLGRVSALGARVRDLTTRVQEP